MSVYLLKEKSFQARSATITMTNLVFDIGQERFDKVKGTLDDGEVADRMNRILKVNRAMNHSTGMSVRFHITYDDSPYPKLELEVSGPFISRLLREYFNESWKLSVEMGFVLDGSNVFDQINQEMRPVFAEDGEDIGDSVFGKRWIGKHLQLDYRREQSTYSGFLTIKVAMMQMDFFGGIHLLDCQRTNKRILEEKVACDFELVARNDARFTCHSMFLKEIPMLRPIFDSSTYMEAQERSSKLDLCEEGVGALLKYVYYNDNSDLIYNGKLAVELLKFANYSLYDKLGKEMRELILSGDVDWLTVDVSYSLYSHCLSVGTEPELKWKAAQTIKQMTDWNQLGPRDQH